MLLICTTAYAVSKAQHALFGSNNQPQDQMHTAPTALPGDLLHQCLKCKVCTMPLLYALLRALLYALLKSVAAWQDTV